MHSRPYILTSVLLMLLVISACQTRGPEPSTPPVASSTPQLVVETPEAIISATQVFEPSLTASLTPLPESTATATPTLPATLSPLMIAPENADGIQELASLGGSEIGLIADVAWSPDGKSSTLGMVMPSLWMYSKVKSFMK
jgi:hypothetical protein